ncbi:MAG TPA: CsgG/HfaB family protein [Fibrobacteraceae bacterium]|nr:CsgG/HfaB family protein [Fibrobacteraceae bacterium]
MFHRPLLPLVLGICCAMNLWAQEPAQTVAEVPDSVTKVFEGGADSVNPLRPPTAPTDSPAPVAQPDSAVISSSSMDIGASSQQETPLSSSTEAQMPPLSLEASSSSRAAPAVNLVPPAPASVNPSTGVKSLPPSSSSAIDVYTSIPATRTQGPTSRRKPNVAILEFTGSYKVFSREEIQSITNRFETELMKTDSFVVLERRNMDAILQEQGFQQTGACNSAECQVQVGQLLGVDRILTGEVSKVGDIISLNIKMVDVEKGNNLLSHVIDIKGELQDVLRGGCYEMAQIFSGQKKPENERSVLTAEKSSVWPWIIGGVAIVGLGVGGTILYLNMNKDEGKSDEYDIQ